VRSHFLSSGYLILVLCLLSSAVEQEQVQKRTFTNWINAQLSKRNSPSLVQDLFADLSDGTRLLDLLEVMSGQRLVSVNTDLSMMYMPWDSSM
uniref:Calponin-homology (CH) domain-containing protein n=1 Tax=Astyanax mexicanus TaxID=7994 RepID=A0A8B9LVM5_ASTMX